MVTFTQISCEVHLKSNKINCNWGNFYTDFVWCPTSKIIKTTPAWCHLTQVSCEGHPKSEDWNCNCGHFETDFLWSPTSEIIRRKPPWLHLTQTSCGVQCLKSRKTKPCCHLIQISCEVHPKSQEWNCNWGHFDTHFVWCPTSEIIKSKPPWLHLTRISCDIQHLISQNLNLIGCIWHRFSYEVHPKSKEWNFHWGHFDTDFVWYPTSVITKFIISFGSFDTDFVWSTPEIKRTIVREVQKFCVISNIYNFQKQNLLGGIWHRYRVKYTQNLKNQN